MSKGKTQVIGLTPNFRPGKRGDSFRVGVLPPGGVFFFTSAKVDPKLREINEYLRRTGLRQDDALADPTFQALAESYYQWLKAEHGLKEYRAREQVELNSKAFDFEASTEAFCAYKAQRTSNAFSQKSVLKEFWLPYFVGVKGCRHPSQFHHFALDAETHLRTAKKLNSEERYSPTSLPGMASALHEYLRYLVKAQMIQAKETFTIEAGSTLEQQKRGRTNQSRRQDVYSIKDILEIKKKIDKRYAEDEEMKLRAYTLLFGVCTGIRRANLVGMKAGNIHPDASRPFFEVTDSVVNGWSRGLKGSLLLELSTKHSVGHSIALPFVQPNVPFLQEIARFIRSKLTADEYLIPRDGDHSQHGNPTTVYKWWQAIADECRFKFLSPHDWKHSYATNGALNLQEWYRGNPTLLQACCMHEKYETTQRYIRNKSTAVLDAFGAE